MSKRQSRERGSDYPCATLLEALPDLRRPPAAEAVRFKIQNITRDGSAAQIAAYVDARLVFDRLDLVCGGEWHAEFEELPEPLRSRPAPVPIDVRCRLTVFGVTRQDVGEGEDPKAAFSDAIKRAAVHFGVGRVLYAMRLPWLREGTEDGELRRNRKGRLVLDARTERWCREQYARWLDVSGRVQFGDPLDHGDQLGSAGFEEAEGASTDAPQAATAEPAPTEGRQKKPPVVAVDTAGEPSSGGAASEQAPPAPLPVPAESAVLAQRVAGRLVAVSDGTPGDPPADARDRALISEWQQQCGYRDDTVAQLASIACGEKVLERLTRQQVKRVTWLLECAKRGRVTQRSLQGALTRLAKRNVADETKATALETWLTEKADEVGLLGRREAA
jgi:hypothetical protein